jgi:hypothetical protein
MKRSDRSGERLLATFVLGWVLLNYPILSLFARPLEMAGIPLLYAFVFATWSLLILIMALVVELGRD